MNGEIEGVGGMWQQLPRMGGGRSRKMGGGGEGPQLETPTGPLGWGHPISQFPAGCQLPLVPHQLLRLKAGPQLEAMPAWSSQYKASIS